jgi:hypothetical protein
MKGPRMRHEIPTPSLMNGPIHGLYTMLWVLAFFYMVFIVGNNKSMRELLEMSNADVRRANCSPNLKITQVVTNFIIHL